MTEEQLKALRSLERAFKKCRQANIGFYIEESDVYAFPDWDELEANATDHAWLKENLHDVDCSNAIVDCGAW